MARLNLPEKDEYRNLARAGKRDDTSLAHVTPGEIDLLTEMGGIGTHNPTTGLLQFYGGDDADHGGDDRSETGGGPQNSTNNDNPDFSQPNEGHARSTPDPTTTTSDRGFWGGIIDGITAIPDRISSFFDNPFQSIEKGLQDPKSTAGLAGMLAPTTFSPAMMAMENINNSFFGGNAKSTFADGPFSGSQGQPGSMFGGGGFSGNKDNAGITAGAEQGGEGRTDGRSGLNNSSSGGSGGASGGGSSFNFPPDDPRYNPGTPANPNLAGRAAFLAGIGRTDDEDWLKSNVGFGNGDELLDSIFNPQAAEADDYFRRAQRRGMLDIPSTQVALKDLADQGMRGKDSMRQQLIEQGDSFTQPLRSRAAELTGQVNSGAFDNQTYSDDLLAQLFGTAITDVKGRAGDFGTDVQAFSPASSLYKGLEVGGDIRGNELLSALANRNRSNAGTQRTRGIGSHGVF